ncbi:MAG TPA: hypothetical protein VF042_12450 [Gemmatimonadaceae bacterium]
MRRTPDYARGGGGSGVPATDTRLPTVRWLCAVTLSHAIAAERTVSSVTLVQCELKAQAAG